MNGFQNFASNCVRFSKVEVGGEKRTCNQLNLSYILLNKYYKSDLFGWRLSSVVEFSLRVREVTSSILVDARVFIIANFWVCLKLHMRGILKILPSITHVVICNLSQTFYFQRL